MAIRRSIDDLPHGWAPDAEPRFVNLLAREWHEEYLASPDKEHAVPSSRFRHSDAGKCARLIAYKAAGIESTDPMDVTGVWNTRLGTMIHDAWQAALQRSFPGAEVEVKVGGGDRSGHIDALIVWTDGDYVAESTHRVIAYELKSVGGYSFKAAIGKARRGTPPEGPKSEHVIQASLNGRESHADEVVVGYLAKETLSKNYAEVPELSRFAAEWTLTREQYEPIADLEIERVTGILALLDDKGLLARRLVPGVPAEIEDVQRSSWALYGDDDQIIDTGTVWNGSYCAYCSHQTLCEAVGPGRVPVEIAVELRAKL